MTADSDVRNPAVLYFYVPISNDLRDCIVMWCRIVG